MHLFEWLFAAYNGIATGMAIFLVAAGLTWIFGILKILNMAHGHFFMIGVYVAFGIIGRHPESMGSYLLGALAAGAVVSALGYLTDRLLLQRLRNVDYHYVLIGTFALLLCISVVASFALAGFAGGLLVPLQTVDLTVGGSYLLLALFFRDHRRAGQRARRRRRPVNPLLQIENLRVCYGALEVIKGVSLEVASGESFAVIGPNGAGKTTLFKAVTGEVPGSSGSVRFAGQDITRMAVHQRARAGFGRTFQVARVFQGLTVLANVICSVEARLRGAGRSCGPWYAWRPAPAVVDEAEQLLADLSLAHVRPVEARFLSHGDKKRLEIALVLAQQPRVLMLDEPTAGMSHADRLAIVDLILRLRRDKGITVVMTEHDMDVIFGLADRIMVMNYGEVIAMGTPAEVRVNPLVREVYLGKEMVDA